MTKPAITDVGVEFLHHFCLDRKTRQVWLHGTPLQASSVVELGVEPGVEYIMATKLIKNLHILKNDSETKGVLIHMHTCGGDYTEGMAIYDTIKSMPFPVTIVSYTHARSMSSIILQAADKRILMPNSYFLFHRGTTYIEADALTARSISKWCDEKELVMIDIYADVMVRSKKYRKYSKTQLREIVIDHMNRKGDVYLSPAEAVEWGFADEVFRDWKSI